MSTHVPVSLVVPVRTSACLSDHLAYAYASIDRISSASSQRSAFRNGPAYCVCNHHTVGRLSAVVVAYISNMMSVSQSGRQAGRQYNMPSF